MSYHIEKRKMVIDGIRIIQSKGRSIINVKKIRRVLGLSNEDRTNINYIWRNLEYLEKEGFIEKLSDKKPKTYKIIKQITGVIK